MPYRILQRIAGLLAFVVIANFGSGDGLERRMVFVGVEQTTRRFAPISEHVVPSKAHPSYYALRSVPPPDGKLPPPWFARWLTSYYSDKGFIETTDASSGLTFVCEWGAIDPQITHVGRPLQPIDVAGRTIVDPKDSKKFRAYLSAAAPSCIVSAYRLAPADDTPSDQNLLWRTNVYLVLYEVAPKGDVQVGPSVVQDYSSPPTNTETEFSPRHASEAIEMPAVTLSPPGSQTEKISDENRAVFRIAVESIDASAGAWAYTERTRWDGGKDGFRSISVRFDPSRPEETRATLLTVDDRTPNAEDIERWRNSASQTGSPFGSLPSLASTLKLDEVTVVSSDTSQTIFEVSVRDRNPLRLPGEKCRALIYVDLASRAMKELRIFPREALRLSDVAGQTKTSPALPRGAKISSELQIIFKVIDPSSPPQPVRVRMTGSVSWLFVKMSRGFETTRSDFSRTK